jgi:hypothetical protein
VYRLFNILHNCHSNDDFQVKDIICLHLQQKMSCIYPFFAV